MKKHLLAIVFLLVALIPVRGQQVIVNDSTMFISLQVDSLTEAERYFNPIFLIVAEGKEYLKEQLVRGSICDCDTTLPNRRIGIFSVAPNKHVTFSQGNLQYFPAAKLWKFADNQYDYLGVANDHLSPTFRNWVDLFGYSANNTTAPFGISTSTNDADYAGDFVDWGNNWICGDKPNTWRTLDKEEWDYLLHKRHNASQLVGVANISGVNGLIILPDNWVEPAEVNFKSGFHTSFGREYFALHQQFTLEQWSIFEQRGAVFLPASGWRNGKTFTRESYGGHYWSTTKRDSTNAYYLSFSSQRTWINCNALQRGFSIRLVHDTIVPQVIPDPCMVVKINDTLSINMMCVEGSTFMMGEGEYEHQVTLSDYTISQTELTREVWEAVMGTNSSANTTSKRLPVTNISWYDCQVFIEKLNQLTGLRFHLPTEAEWEYAARGGQKSKGYTYAGSNDLKEVAWYNGNSGNTLHAVAQKKPNELGIYDMTGNAWEWCHDWYAPYSTEAQTNPQGPDSGTGRVLRSGSYVTVAERCTAKYRQSRQVDNPDVHIGFRLVLHDTIPIPPEPEYVDLGLSVKWATFNVGASKPEDYGDYFAWGETEPKEEYTWENYKWCDGTDANITKYNSTDGKTILEPADDAAQVHWGGKWRMPTKEELKELIDSCQWERVTLNSVIGNKITGPNGNSIFIPAAGSYNSFDNQLHSVDSAGWLYSSSAVSNTFAREISIGYSGAKSTSCSKCLGLTIRPVYDDRVTLTVIPTPADATVGFYYSEGFNVDSNSVKVKKGSSPLYQVAATKKGYLSQGDTLHHITQDTTLYIALRPFSKGTWVKVDTSEFTRVDSFFVSRHQGVFSGPYSSWSYFYAPVLPGETYRVRAHAGQHAALWYAASNAPDQAAGIRPTKVACSANGGIVRYIAEEFTIPEGANYLIINAASKGTNLIIERKVPDPCLVVKVNDTLSINLMCVEGGTFRMGVGADNYIERDDPQANKDSTTHLVTLSDYYMAETAVTQGLWKAVMGTDIHDMVAQSRYPDDTPKVGDRYPMEYVRLKDALAFIDELNKLTGMHFRLPTETEREYAARGGNLSRYYKYPGSNDYTQVASPYGTPVAQKLPNELGIYDLSGCTREMCTDTWQTTYIYDEHVVNPVGPIQNSGNRTMRGGHIHSKARPFTRYPYTPAWCGNSLGFRIILPTETQRRMIHVNGSFFEMCFVKGGTFMMGSDAPDAQNDEQPVHEVTLTDYYIGQTEVTQHLWKAVMGSSNNPSATKGNSLPVTNISWNEAQTFVERLSELTGMRFRLPTEAEWEYAARGGQKSKGYTYAGSNNADDVAWHIWNTNKLQTVGQLQPNELGIYDMAGNVWEYCSDYYALYEASAQVNPQGPQNSHSGNHVTRGGGWRQNPGFDTSLGYCRVTNRAKLSKSDIVGLRIVLEVEK